MSKVTQKRSAVEVAAQMICDQIAMGKFVPGQRLPEVDLVELLGVSKPVIREVFAKLQEEGIVEIQMYKGAMVRRLSPDEVLEIMSANTVLLAWGMREAALVIANQPQRGETLKEIASNLRHLDPRDQREHLGAFYAAADAITDIANKPYLTKLLQRGLNPLFKEFLLDSVKTDVDVVAQTRALAEVIEIVLRGESNRAFHAFLEWSDETCALLKRAFIPSIDSVRASVPVDKEGEDRAV